MCCCVHVPFAAGVGSLNLIKAYVTAPMKTKTIRMLPCVLVFVWTDAHIAVSGKCSDAMHDRVVRQPFVDMMLQTAV